MVKSKTRRDAEILVKNPNLRLLGKRFQDSKKGKKQTMKKRDFQDLEILPKFSKTHFYRGNIRQPS